MFMQLTCVVSTDFLSMTCVCLRAFVYMCVDVSDWLHVTSFWLLNYFQLIFYWLLLKHCMYTKLFIWQSPATIFKREFPHCLFTKQLYYIFRNKCIGFILKYLWWQQCMVKGVTWIVNKFMRAYNIICMSVHYFV